MEPGSQANLDLADLRHRLIEAMTPLRVLKASMDSLFGDIWPGDWESAESRTHPLRVNVYRAGDRAVVECTVPGASKRDVDVTLSGRVLTITAELRPPQDAPDRFLSHEITTGRWQRAVHLPFDVRVEQMRARCENGLLRVIIEPVVEQDAPSERLPVE